MWYTKNIQFIPFYLHFKFQLWDSRLWKIRHEKEYKEWRRVFSIIFCEILCNNSTIVHSVIPYSNRIKPHKTWLFRPKRSKTQIFFRINKSINPTDKMLSMHIKQTKKVTSPSIIRAPNSIWKSICSFQV